MSSTNPIYNAVEYIVVTVDGKTPTIKNLPDLPSGPLAPSQLPTRLLLPFGAGDNEASVIEYMDFGNNAFVTHTVMDLLLFRAVGEGETAKLKHAEPLANYARDYVNKVIQKRYLDDTQLLEITGTVAKPGQIEYPSQSGNLYHGCLCTLTIREAIVNL